MGVSLEPLEECPALGRAERGLVLCPGSRSEQSHLGGSLSMLLLLAVALTGAAWWGPPHVCAWCYSMQCVPVKAHQPLGGRQRVQGKAKAWRDPLHCEAALGLGSAVSYISGFT